MIYALIVSIHVMGVDQMGDWHRYSIGPLFNQERDCLALAREVMELVIAANVPGHPIYGAYGCFTVSPTKDSNERYILTTRDRGQLFGYLRGAGGIYTYIPPERR
jgi:hypothetical protein